MAKKDQDRGADGGVYGEEYADACACARRIACAEPGDDLCRAFADAVVTAYGHDVTAWDDVVSITYRNEFGPTCGVDEQIERMGMGGWACVAGYAVARVLGRGGESARRVPRVHPSVTLAPECDSDVIRTVTLVFRLPKRLHGRLERALGKQKER